MRKKRHLSKFNLIEIVLAIGVVALGMTAVLALLPPALNANIDSQGDANAAEIASNVITYIDKIAQESAKDTSEFKKVEGDTRTAAEIAAADETAWKTTLENHFETTAPAENSVKVSGESFGNKMAAPFSQFNIESGTSTKPGWMTYVKTEADGTETAVANVYVWMKNITAGAADHEKINGIGSVTVVRSCYRFYIKVCWPADAPADAENRQERTYVHEVLRPVKN